MASPDSQAGWQNVEVGHSILQLHHAVGRDQGSHQARSRLCQPVGSENRPSRQAFRRRANVNGPPSRSASVD